MNLPQSIVIYCFLLHLLNRPLNAFPKLYPLPHPCQGAFPLRFLSAQNRRQRPPSSTSLQKLKIQWANHPCGFDPRRRHQTNKIRTRSSLWETGSDLLFISIFLRRHTSKTDFRSFLRANPVHIGIERKNTKMEVCQNERSNQKMRVQYG